MHRTGIVILIVILAACGSSTMVLNDKLVERSSHRFEGLTLTQIQHGKSVYESGCDLCHGLKNPKDWNEAEWREIVPGMVEMANEQGAEISETDEEALLRYVVIAGTEG